MTHSGRLLLATLCLLLAACGRSLPKYETPLPRAAVQRVRTTAYTHSESDHLQYGAQSACGTPLQYGSIHSAAADWSRWPNGTMFRIQETGEVCQVDDYGWALAGTNTIDLYKPDRSSMNGWGVRRVNIEILQWGDAWASYRILKPRSGYAHIRRMLAEITDRYPRGSHGPEPILMASAAPPAPRVDVPVATRAAIPVSSSQPAAERSAAPLSPFYR